MRFKLRSNRNCHIVVPLALAVVASVPTAAWAADISEISAEDYYGAAYYAQALEHPRVARQKSEKRRLKLVARDMRWKRRRLAKAVAKVRGLPGEPIELARRAVEAGLQESRVQDRVRDVLVNADEPKHVVMYIRWQAGNTRDLVKEASTIASVVAEKAPLVSTLSLASIHPKAATDSKRPIWAAKIGRRAMARISRARIDDYADRMYRRLFEVEETPSP